MIFTREFIEKNKLKLFILLLVSLIIFFIAYGEQRENINVAGIISGLLFEISLALLPCLCWLLIMYIIAKKGAAAAIRESGLIPYY